ncbi:PPOX class F420-dependent oxidoreductase [Mycobacterium nebraskense]|uniref:Pyridoxamine 5-phosphate oxidase n=1 Tax=Mycobacterium nebraskense TaxID=244292 RepID=A0A1X1Z4A7_9MYCO|nr:PPOX class F420-dependent oxidoreductase [Mycobacterium nebraskense]KKC04736.1 pyridoxamine 5-phosphate oxidase [Mycobacterium nebraskense]MBI2697471.1 PPOX class F420-dependent oxidoreductase [Mycobacterium nebraskense]MCV7118950.1 PPOX class F420-dependent oxidoreductase [Mycobacterium nebraskense]ORW18124.1 pyridoxamine 5-phosphate oxidase [Mycobacterium nebraskense]
MHTRSPADLSTARYALLRSFRRDGTPVDTPIWFGLDGDALLFRTKVGPKTRRLTAHRDVELTACDYRGRVRPGAMTVAGRATILSGADAERANRILRKRYGWQWNIVPLIKVPGITNVHQGLCVREKLSRARDRGVWADSVIVRVDVP